MRAAIFILATLTNFLCAILLLRAFSRVRARLLLWSGLCFIGLGFASAMVFVDLILFPAVDLFLWRLLITFFALCLLVYGLIQEKI